MQQGTITLIVAGLGIAGTFGSGAMTLFVSQRFDIARWRRDERMKEWRELLVALATYFTALLDIYQPMRPQSPTEQMKLADLKAETFRIIHSRIFIRDEVIRLEIETRWLNTERHYRVNGDVVPFAQAYDELVRDVVAAAIEK
ncbi:MAG TPA: hypothetical protein VMD97_02935 [Candidatus Aquilonibacter sp.]|nr:hypothetical protein [Candidatus Aquilonibacter sp.]